MADAKKGHIEIVNGSIGDLIFRIETLTSDRDTIKVCVRAANELSAMKNRIATLEAENARLTAANEAMQEDAVQNTYAFELMLKANKEQAEEIEKLKREYKQFERAVSEDERQDKNEIERLTEKVRYAYIQIEALEALK